MVKWLGDREWGRCTNQFCERFSVYMARGLIVASYNETKSKSERFGDLDRSRRAFRRYPFKVMNKTRTYQDLEPLMNSTSLSRKSSMEETFRTAIGRRLCYN